MVLLNFITTVGCEPANIACRSISTLLGASNSVYQHSADSVPAVGSAIAVRAPKANAHSVLPKNDLREPERRAVWHHFSFLSLFMLFPFCFGFSFIFILFFPFFRPFQAFFSKARIVPILKQISRKYSLFWAQFFSFLKNWLNICHFWPISRRLVPFFWKLGIRN